jgi:cysteinyl-tRNA synthetase
MPLQLYNTLTRTKEEFVPVTPGHAGIYYCGPTVYSEPHLGHARGPVTFDVLKRWLQHEGLQVRLVSNITDVGHLTDDADEGEDKLLQRAVLERVEPMELADRYFWAYQDAMAQLNVLRPDITPRASGHITEQISLIEELIRRGLAYESHGSVYFEVSKWDAYGALSGRVGDDQITGTRVALREEKRDPRDFALWKHAEPGHIMRWPSPWGEGYPGWHIECSAMSIKYLGAEFDIHGGGMDLVFPHHEAEIAQSQGAGHAFAHYWLHFNTITLDGEKMARSKDHFVLLKDLFSRFDPIDIRFYLLRAHYRSVMDFTEESVESATAGLRRLQDTYRLLLARQAEPAPDARHADLDVFRQRFAQAMNDDLNTPQALAALFDAAREINRELAGSPSVEYLRAARSLFDDLFSGVLGLTSQAADTTGDDRILAGVIELLLEQRKLARQQRDFAGADRIRQRLTELGVTIEDTPEGSRWKLA